MTLDDLSQDIYKKVKPPTTGPYSIDPILIGIIGAIIQGLIMLIFNHFTNKTEAAQEFANYYGHLGLLKRIALRRYVKRRLDVYPPERTVSAKELADAIGTRLSTVTAENVLELYGQQ